MKPGQILATGLLFFLLFMPLFSFIGDMRVMCEFENVNSCSEYSIMQGVIGAGLFFGLMLSVGGAYKMRHIVKGGGTLAFGKYSLQDHNMPKDIWTEDAISAELSFIEQYGIDDSVLADVLNVLQREKDNAQNDTKQLLAQLSNNTDIGPELEELKQKQNSQKNRVEDIENAMARIKNEMEDVKESQSKTNLDMKDSVISGDVKVNDPQEIAEAAIKAYRMGQKSNGVPE